MVYDRKVSDRKYWLNSMRGTFSKQIRSYLYKRKHAALKKGFEFCITPDSFAEITHCPLLPNREFKFNNTKKNTDNSPSVDRIDPTKGYTPENTWIISQRANRIKNNATLEEFEEIAKNWRAEVNRRKKLYDK